MAANENTSLPLKPGGEPLGTPPEAGQPQTQSSAELPDVAPAGTSEEHQNTKPAHTTRGRETTETPKHKETHVNTTGPLVVISTTTTLAAQTTANYNTQAP